MTGKRKVEIVLGGISLLLCAACFVFIAIWLAMPDGRWFEPFFYALVSLANLNLAYDYLIFRRRSGN